MHEWKTTIDIWLKHWTGFVSSEKEKVGFSNIPDEKPSEWNAFVFQGQAEAALRIEDVFFEKYIPVEEKLSIRCARVDVEEGGVVDRQPFGKRGDMVLERVVCTSLRVRDNQRINRRSNIPTTHVLYTIEGGRAKIADAETLKTLETPSNTQADNQYDEYSAHQLADAIASMATGS